MFPLVGTALLFTISPSRIIFIKACDSTIISTKHLCTFSKGHIWYDLIYMKHPEKANPYRHKAPWWEEGLERKGMAANGYGVSLTKMFCNCVVVGNGCRAL